MLGVIEDLAEVARGQVVQSTNQHLHRTLTVRTIAGRHQQYVFDGRVFADRVDVDQERRVRTNQHEHQFTEVSRGEGIGFGFGFLRVLGEEGQSADVAWVVFLGNVWQQAAGPCSTSGSAVGVGQSQEVQLRRVGADPAGLTYVGDDDGRGEQLSFHYRGRCVALRRSSRCVFQVDVAAHRGELGVSVVERISFGVAANAAVHGHLNVGTDRLAEQVSARSTGEVQLGGQYFVGRFEGADVERSFAVNTGQDVVATVDGYRQQLRNIGVVLVADVEVGRHFQVASIGHNCFRVGNVFLHVANDTVPVFVAQNVGDVGWDFQALLTDVQDARLEGHLLVVDQQRANSDVGISTFAEGTQYQDGADADAVLVAVEANQFVVRGQVLGCDSFFTVQGQSGQQFAGAAFGVISFTATGQQAVHVTEVSGASLVGGAGVRVLSTHVAWSGLLTVVLCASLFVLNCHDSCFLLVGYIRCSTD
ncbi:hypothetical protein D3C72_1174610 [compost metagenome]